MNTGMVGGSLKVLSSADIERIHQASLSLLEQHGVTSDSDLILDIFRRAGAETDLDERLIRVPTSMVEAALAAAPRSFKSRSL